MTAEDVFPVIANPTAGSGKAGRSIDATVAAAKTDGVHLDVRLTDRRGHATELAKEAADSGAPVLAVLGGDGTIREVASALVGTQTALGVLPMGSGNDFARSLGIPRALDEALRVLREGVERRVDVGEDAAGLFVCVSGIGFAAEVSHEANNSRVLRGSLTYFMGVFKALARLTPAHLTLRLDDREIDVDAVFVMAQNTPYCGGGQLMAPNAQVDDGLLDVVVVSAIGRLELARTLPKVYSGAHQHHPKFSVYRTSRLDVRSEVPVRKMLDGDVVGYEPLRARVHREPLRVLVPASSIESSSSSAP